MATIPRPPGQRKIEYPTSDGKPMAETDVHRKLMVDLIETLDAHFAADPRVYVSGDLLLFYEEGNKRRHVAPDVFVVLGVPKLPLRLHYLLWEEGKAPDFIIEVTSKTTRGEDQKKKRLLYRDVLKVPEYFLFDPFEEYLKPSMQGYRLVAGEYEAIAPVAGQLPSEVLGLHLERDGTQLRLVDPVSGRRLPTQRERLQAAEAESERMRREIEALKRRLNEAN
jgi:Uma2 family endonuclease